MDINKLDITHNDIDKNTGRIILPSSSELEEINTSSFKNKMVAPTPATNKPEHSSKADAAPTPFATAPSHTNEKSQHISEAPKESPAYTTRTTETQNQPRKTSWTISPIICISLCLFFFTLPLAIISALVIYENSQLRSQFDDFNRRLHLAEKRSESLSTTAVKEKLILTSEIQQLKKDLFSKTAQSVTSSPAEAAPVENKEPDDKANYIYVDENGNIIPEEEALTGNYIVEEE